MNIKKEAYNQIIENLRKQVSDIDLQISRNKRKFRDLEHEQGILKKMKAEVVKLLGIVQKDREGNNAKGN